jgi:hypothetical protein
MSLLVVILSSLGTLLGCVLAANQILRGMRRKWQQDAEQTKAVRDNTKAVQDLTAQLGGLNSKVNDHERRLASKGI